MSKRSKRTAQGVFFNGTRSYELYQLSKRRFTTDRSEEKTHPIPLPFINDTNDIFGEKPIHSESESINFGAENLCTDSENTSTIPLPTSPNKPSTSRQFIFLNSPGTPENASLLTDSDSPSSESSEDELASNSSYHADGIPRIQKRLSSRSDYYRERLNQLEREQQDRRERWKKKLELMEKLLNK